MADLVITAANVIPSTITGIANNIKQGTAGASITAGQSVYQDATAGNVVKLADANGTVATAAATGIALQSATSGQPISFMTAGALAFGAILLAGKYYVVSATPGGIAPVADLTTGWYSTLLGYGYSTSVMIVGVKASGILVA